MDRHAEKICLAVQAAEREAAERMLRARHVPAECKSDPRDVVTQYDREIQALLIERLGAAVPAARFFCEENGQQDELQAEQVFVIDPIDGTMNFVRHLNHSCISVAYLQRGALMAGAVYNPYVDEMFHAVRGGGAFLNGRPIRVDEGPLAETLVCVGTSPYRDDLVGETFRRMERLYRASLDIRRQGSAALDLCSVAAGRAGLYVEMSLSLWDYAAGALIVEEAGGRCLTADGAPLPFDESKPSIAAGGAQALADYLALED